LKIPKIWPPGGTNLVGVPLPLMSYGGTALITLLLGVGILMSVSTHHQLNKS